MNRHDKQIDEMIASAGGKKVRRWKHRVYRFADGRVFVRPSSSSSQRSSLNSISTLKRFLAEPKAIERSTEIAPAQIANFESSQRKRTSQAPVPASLHGEVIIPALGRVDRKAQRDVKTFTSLDDLLTIADQVDDYWRLCSAGRVRTLQKLASAKFKTDIFTVLPVRVGINDLMEFTKDIEDRDYVDALGLSTWRTSRGPTQVLQFTRPLWSSVQAKILY